MTQSESSNLQGVKTWVSGWNPFINESGPTIKYVGGVFRLEILIGSSRTLVARRVSARFYTPEHYPGSHYPRIQILTIEELLNGAQAQYPRLAQRRGRAAGTQSTLV